MLDLMNKNPYVDGTYSFRFETPILNLLRALEEGNVVSILLCCKYSSP